MATKIIKTLDELINKEDRYDLNKVAFFAHTADEDLVILDTTLFHIYWKYFEPAIGEYKVKKTEREYYHYRPDRLSADIYGTPALAWLIMKLNDQECPSKFHVNRTIRLIPANQIAEIFDTIVTKSKDRLEQNWAEELTRLE